jgi:hypothetical protein
LTAGVCPFCAHALEGLIAIPPPNRRMSRGAVFAFASSITIAGCGSAVESPAPTDAAFDTLSTDTGQPGTLYGGVPADTGVDDMGTIDAAYGAPADTGSGGALYGAAPDK